jgi:hypothetical protein
MDLNHKTIERRREMRKAIAHLMCILELYDCNDSTISYSEMKKGIGEFITWIENESPIS